MKWRKTIPHFCLAVLLFVPLAGWGASLAERLAQVKTGAAEAGVGIGVLDLGTGESWYLDGDRPFPMQSVFKFPLAVAVLKLVDEGKLSLGQEVSVGPEDFAPCWSPLRDEYKGQPMSLTVQELMSRSLLVSDNTAADVLLRLIGGAETVNAVLAAANVQGIRVDRMERELQPACAGLSSFRADLAWPKAWAAAVEALPNETRKAALKKYLDDPRDTATPRGMTDLLAKLWQRKLLSAKSTDLLLKIMEDSVTGQKRLRAGLPKGWRLAHKTGSGPEVLGVGSATNDVGIAIAGDGRAFAMVVFVAGSHAAESTRENLMAEVAAATAQ